MTKPAALLLYVIVARPGRLEPVGYIHAVSRITPELLASGDLLACNGAEFDPATYRELYRVLGRTYGGARAWWAPWTWRRRPRLPDLRGYMPPDGRILERDAYPELYGAWAEAYGSDLKLDEAGAE